MKVHLRSCGAKVVFTAPVLILLLTMVFTPRPSIGFYAVYIHPSVGQTSEATLQRLARLGINTIFVDVYYPTEIGRGVFQAEKKAPWTGKSKEPRFTGSYSLDDTITTARKLGISVHVTISCFGELPAIDPANELHRLHLREIAEYILTNFPSISGIHLDYVRYMHEWGLDASGNPEPVTSFVRDLRLTAKGKALSAAVFAAANWEDYNVIVFKTGQNCREISQYLDFMCPMAYHLSAGKDSEWIGSVTRFMSSIVQKPCRIFTTLQAYFQFGQRIVVSDQKTVGTSISGPTVELPSAGVLQFILNWQNPASRFSLTITDPLSRKIPTETILKRLTNPTSVTYEVNSNTIGFWSTELNVDLLPVLGDNVTVHISDLNEELPGYQVLRSAISIATESQNGFCVYALNNLSQEESRAIKDSIDYIRISHMRYL